MLQQLQSPAVESSFPHLPSLINPVFPASSDELEKEITTHAANRQGLQPGLQ